MYPVAGQRRFSPTCLRPSGKKKMSHMLIRTPKFRAILKNKKSLNHNGYEDLCMRKIFYTLPDSTER